MELNLVTMDSAHSLEPSAFHYSIVTSSEFSGHQLCEHECN
jgi:hypothetical protein